MATVCNYVAQLFKNRVEIIGNKATNLGTIFIRNWTFENMLNLVRTSVNTIGCFAYILHSMPVHLYIHHLTIKSKRILENQEQLYKRQIKLPTWMPWCSLICNYARFYSDVLHCYKMIFWKCLLTRCCVIMFLHNCFMFYCFSFVSNLLNLWRGIKWY